MTSLYPDRAELETPVLRGAEAGAATAARMDSDLRTSRFVRSEGDRTTTDARLLDPRLEVAFEKVAEGVRDSARAQGFAAGWAKGQAAASEEVRYMAGAAEAARLSEDREHRLRAVRALQALTDAATSLEARAVLPAAAIRDELLAGALELVEVLLGHELSVATSPGLDAVRRALDLAPQGSPVTVALHPEDRAAVAGLIDGGLDLGRPVEFTADATLARGEAVATCAATRIDARLHAAIQRVREVLA